MWLFQVWGARWPGTNKWPSYKLSSHELFHSPLWFFFSWLHRFFFQEFINFFQFFLFIFSSSSLNEFFSYFLRASIIFKVIFKLIFLHFGCIWIISCFYYRITAIFLFCFLDVFLYWHLLIFSSNWCGLCLCLLSNLCGLHLCLCSLLGFQRRAGHGEDVQDRGLVAE